MTRVIFKEEDTLDDGQPIGAVTVLSDAEAVAAEDAHPLMGEHFRPACICDSGKRAGGPREECGRCGKPIRESWKTFAQAKQIAAREGAELEVN